MILTDDWVEWELIVQISRTSILKIFSIDSMATSCMGLMSIGVWMQICTNYVWG